MFSISRRERIVAAGHSVRIPPLAVTALNAHFAAAEGANRRLSLPFGKALLVVNTLWIRNTTLFHGPIRPMLHYKPVVLCHLLPFTRVYPAVN